MRADHRARRRPIRPSRRCAAASASPRSSTRCAATATRAIGDFSPLGLAGALSGANGAAFLGVNPMHALFAERPRPRQPLSSLRPPLPRPAVHRRARRRRPPRDDALAAALAALGPALVARRAERTSTTKRRGRASAKRLRRRYRRLPARARRAAGRPRCSPTTRASSPSGGEALRRFAVFQAIADERGGEDWRRWPAPCATREPAALEPRRAERADDVRLRAVLPMARRPPARGRRGAGESRAALEIGLYRDLAVGSAPDGAESWARAGELALKASASARRPIRSRPSGQIWNVPPPDPIAWAREGWRGSRALYAANMRHAGMLRIDHAMGLPRLFVIPDGAKPAEGAYVAYPLDDLIGHIALESQRAACMVVGEDLGTVPDGFRDKLTRADILGHARAVVRARRRRASCRPPNIPRSPSPAPPRTTCRRSPAGGTGADIAERLALGLPTSTTPKARSRGGATRSARFPPRSPPKACSARRRTSPARCPTRSPARSTPFFPAPVRCWRARSSTISPANAPRPICREPTASVRIGAGACPSASRRCSPRRAPTRFLTALNAPRR